jgi:Uma2 family endonuclease
MVAQREGTAKPPARQRTAALAVAAPPEDPYRYGWRVMPETLPNGEIDYRYVPLTQVDFLDPQLGDQMVQSDQHVILVVSLFNRFTKRYLADPTVGVYSDVKLLWGVPGLKEPAPDLAVVPNLQSKEQYHRSFDVVKEGTRPCLIVEVVSPNYPGDDTTKVAIYQAAQVAEYIVLDPHFEDETLDFELIGRRLKQGQYEQMKPDEQGRLLSETTGVWFELGISGRSLILTDAVTNLQLLTDEEEYEARLKAEERAETAEQRASAAEAEIARLKALLSQRKTNGDRKDP